MFVGGGEVISMGGVEGRGLVLVEDGDGEEDEAARRL